jgi:hypothetical protein
MVSSLWPQWAKSNLQGVLGAKGQQNGQFCGHAGAGTTGASAGKGGPCQTDVCNKYILQGTLGTSV